VIVSYADVDGLAPIQYVGALKLVVKDVTLTSEAANDAGDFVVDPGDVGLVDIFGVFDLHVYGGAAADQARSIDFAPATNTVTFMATDRGALDLDAADTSTARLMFVGV
jgi:hypothetical protein